MGRRVGDYSSAEIANYFLDLADKQGETITPLKLQKLLYCAHGWHLAVYGKPLLREAIEAWKWGPVISSIYHEFKGFKGKPITSRAMDFRQDADGNWGFYVPQISAEKIRSADEHLHKVWNTYRSWTAGQMADASHREGSPWRQVVAKMGDEIRPNEHIDDDLIKDHFTEKYKKHLEKRGGQNRGG